ncbi:MAG: FHA domain-containing protein [Acidobacteria bacterium]|nr:MAG: FHA domain-containing protein [Acidobacteriota bacterium]
MAQLYQNAEIRIVQGTGKGTRHSFSKNIVTIGTGPHNDVVIAEEPGACELHAEIQRHAGDFFLYDRSTTGTKLNHQRIETARLANRDRIYLGANCVLEFQLISDEQARAAGTEPKKSLLQRPVILVAGAVYLVVIVVLIFALSGSTPTAETVGTDEALRAINDYISVLERQGVKDRDARLREIQSAVRSGHLAEKEGRLGEARRVYAEMLIRNSAERNSMYRYALRKLQELER